MQAALPEHQAAARVRLPRTWQRVCRTRSRCHVSRYIDPAVTRCSKRFSVRAEAGKGFGKPQEAKGDSADNRAAKPKQPSKGRNTQPPANDLGAAAQGWQKADGKQHFDDAFDSRLKGLQDQSAQRIDTTQQQQQRQQPPLGAKDIYAEPPPLSRTLFGKKDKKDADIPPTFFNQKFLTAASLVLVGIFLISTFAFGQSEEADKPSPTFQAELKAQQLKRAKELESQYASDSADLVALESAAQSYTNVEDYKKAEDLLRKLVAASPDSIDAWRELGQARTSLADYKGAAAAYVKLLELSPSITSLSELATAYTDDGQYQTALNLIKSIRDKLTSTPEELATLGYGKAELDLLLGRTYAQWPGHDGQAMQYYDQLISRSPDDFRGYLARGVLFRGQGKQGDAWRMFMQARYMAPSEAKYLVDRVIGDKRVS